MSFSRSIGLAADSALDDLRDVCQGVLSVCLSEMRERWPGIQARLSGGRSKKNDYRNYQWVSVKFGDHEYLIVTHHGNLDVRTGNPHTQFGRIQFWRCEGPNGPHTRDVSGIWRFRADNEDGSLPATRVWDEGFSVRVVIDRFAEFLVRNGEGDALAALASGPVSSPDPTPPLVERRRADSALETVRAAEAEAQSAVAAELRGRHPEWKVRAASGNSRVNDYRLYRWIVVETEHGTYWISFICTDLDPYTGNIHAQPGRIQFWSGIHHETDAKTEAGPHVRDAGGWVFRADRSWDALPRLHLWSPDFSRSRVVDLFEEFIAEVRP